MAEHLYVGKGHDIIFSETKSIASTKHYFTRLNREAIEIYKNRHRSLNRKEECLRLDKVWRLALDDQTFPVENRARTTSDETPAPENDGKCITPSAQSAADTEE